MNHLYQTDLILQPEHSALPYFDEDYDPSPDTGDSVKPTYPPPIYVRLLCAIMILSRTNGSERLARNKSERHATSKAAVLESLWENRRLSVQEVRLCKWHRSFPNDFSLCSFENVRTTHTASTNRLRCLQTDKSPFQKCAATTLCA